MDIKDFEQEIATVIQAKIVAASISAIAEPIPENTLEFEKPFDDARVWVAYHESEFSELLDNTAVIQEEKIKFCVTVQSRVLRGNTGIYALKRMVHDALVGYTPANCTKPVHSWRFGPPHGEPALLDDTWTFEYYFKTETQAVQAIDINDAVVTPNYQSSSALVTITEHLPNVGAGAQGYQQ